MANSVAALAHRAVHTVQRTGGAPNTIVVLTVLGASEICPDGTGDKDFWCDRIGRYTELRAENRQAKTLCALVDKEHVSTGIETDRAPNDTSCIRTSRPAGRTEECEGFVSELEVREVVVVRLIGQILDDATGIPSFVVSPSGLRRMILAEAVDNHLDTS